MIVQRGCLSGSEAEFGRRDFIKVGSLGFLGIHLAQALHYAATGHIHNPAMQFPSFGAIVAKEMGPLNGMPPYVLAPRWEKNRQYMDSFKSAFLGPDFDPMTIPDPASQNFQVDDLTL